MIFLLLCYLASGAAGYDWPMPAVTVAPVSAVTHVSRDWPWAPTDSWTSDFVSSNAITCTRTSGGTGYNCDIIGMTFGTGFQAVPGDASITGFQFRVSAGADRGDCNYLRLFEFASNTELSATDQCSPDVRLPGSLATLQTDLSLWGSMGVTPSTVASTTFGVALGTRTRQFRTNRPVTLMAASLSVHYSIAVQLLTVSLDAGSPPSQVSLFGTNLNADGASAASAVCRYDGSIDVQPLAPLNEGSVVCPLPVLSFGAHFIEYSHNGLNFTTDGLSFNMVASSTTAPTSAPTGAAVVPTPAPTTPAPTTPAPTTPAPTTPAPTTPAPTPTLPTPAPTTPAPTTPAPTPVFPTPVPTSLPITLAPTGTAAPSTPAPPTPNSSVVPGTGSSTSGAASSTTGTSPSSSIASEPTGFSQPPSMALDPTPVPTTPAPTPSGGDGPSTDLSTDLSTPGALQNTPAAGDFILPEIIPGVETWLFIALCAAACCLLLILLVAVSVLVKKKKQKNRRAPSHRRRPSIGRAPSSSGASVRGSRRDSRRHSVRLSAVAADDPRASGAVSVAAVEMLDAGDLESSGGAGTVGTQLYRGGTPAASSSKHRRKSKNHSRRGSIPSAPLLPNEPGNESGNVSRNSIYASFPSPGERPDSGSTTGIIYSQLPSTGALAPPSASREYERVPVKLDGSSGTSPIVYSSLGADAK